MAFQVIFTNISSIIDDVEFGNENICYSIINEQPCVKNVLRGMLNLVNKNSNTITCANEMAEIYQSSMLVYGLLPAVYKMKVQLLMNHIPP